MNWKRTFNILTLLVIAAAIYVSAMGSHRQGQLAKQGAETHDAICTFRADLQRRFDDGQAFLRMTPEERMKKYGPSLGSTPESVVKNSLANQQQTLDSLGALDCP